MTQNPYRITHGDALVTVTLLDADGFAVGTGTASNDHDAMLNALVDTGMYFEDALEIAPRALIEAPRLA